MGRLYMHTHPPPRRRLRRPLAGLVVLLGLSAVAWHLNQPETIVTPSQRPIRNFQGVALRDAMPVQRESAWAFRSALPSGPTDNSPAGRWISLNPLDPSQAPQILDGITRQLIQIATDYPQTGPWQIEQVLELGPFEQGLAPARVMAYMPRPDSAGQTVQRRELWGYVDPRGQWRIAPQYAQAEPWANGLARIVPLGSLAQPQLIDQGGQQRHSNVTARLGSDWTLRPWGRHVILSRDDEHWLFPADGSAPALLPCCRVEQSDPSGTLNLLSSRGDALFHLYRGEISVRSPAAGRLRPLLDHVYAEARPNAAGEIRYRVLSTEPDRAALAEELSDVWPFLPDAFVACVAGQAPLLMARGTSKPLRRLSAAPRCGLMDGRGRWRLSPDYHSLIELDNGLLRLGRDQHWCAARRDGSLIGSCSDIPPTALLSAGLLPDVGPTAPWLGYRDENGQWRIPPQFHEAGAFVGRIAQVRQHSLPGLIDPHGRWLTPEPPANLIALAWENLHRRPEPGIHDIGLINRRGEMVLPFLFREVSDLAEDGSARVCPAPESIPCQRIDPSGRRVPSQYRSAEPYQSPLPMAELTPVERQGRWGYLDRQGKLAISPRFDAAQPFYAGAAWVRLGPRWGLLDTTGRWLQPAVFLEAKPFSAGVAAVRHENGKLTLLSPNGRGVQVEGVEEIGPFSSGLAVARTHLGYGYLTPTGRWAIPPRYRSASDFIGSHAVVAGALPGHWTPPQQRSPYLVQNVTVWPAARLARIAVLVDGQTRYGLVDDAGRWLLPHY
ncbi:WG repeat-containing protein [Chitinimonas lacunae]|uniref:WG repeat-containing protein n=1 Tax=Chitinimonas lacunae TaxID=1963018 RepID=A0ABV8MRP9_9NEIS